MITGELYSVTVKGEDLYKYRKGALIQEAFPTLSPSDREFLLTGVSPKGWKELYFEEEEAIANDMLNAPWRCASSEGY
jgi:hypothetical protein